MSEDAHGEQFNRDVETYDVSADMAGTSSSSPGNIPIVRSSKLKKGMTVEQVLRRIESQCRDDITAFTDYTPTWRIGGGPIMKGAVSEARGVVDCCQDIRNLCRQIRREHKGAKL